MVLYFRINTKYNDLTKQFKMFEENREGDNIYEYELRRLQTESPSHGAQLLALVQIILYVLNTSSLEEAAKVIWEDEHYLRITYLDYKYMSTGKDGAYSLEQCTADIQALGEVGHHKKVHFK